MASAKIRGKRDEKILFPILSIVVFRAAPQLTERLEPLALKAKNPQRAS